jgi:hypothetical protein
MAITVDTARYLLDLVREERSCGARPARSRQAQIELERCIADAQSSDLPPLQFHYHPHPTLPLNVWNLGETEVEVDTGSARDLGLHMLLIAVEMCGRRVDLSALDAGVIENGVPSSKRWYAVAVSRARDWVAKRCPDLGDALQSVEIRNDCSACYTPKPGQREIIVKSC